MPGSQGGDLPRSVVRERQMMNAIFEPGPSCPGNPTKYELIRIDTPEHVRQRVSDQFMKGLPTDPPQAWVRRQLIDGANPSPSPSSPPLPMTTTPPRLVNRNADGLDGMQTPPAKRIRTTPDHDLKSPLTKQQWKQHKKEHMEEDSQVDSQCSHEDKHVKSPSAVTVSSGSDEGVRLTASQISPTPPSPWSITQLRASFSPSPIPKRPVMTRKLGKLQSNCKDKADA